MRHGGIPSGRRSSRNNRSNSSGGGGGNGRNKVYESNGPEMRVRGTASQVMDKYEVLARDAAACGDRILAESYLQYAEHYRRIVNTFQDESSFVPIASLSVEEAVDEALSLPNRLFATSTPVEKKEEEKVRS